MKPGNFSGLVLIPSYNSGELVAQTAASALREWPHVWVVIDGSRDGSEASLKNLSSDHRGFHVEVLPKNQGKGGAVFHAMRLAHEQGFTHALVMDSDGQHPSSEIQNFFHFAMADPEVMILGEPIFGEDAPPERVHGRRVGNFFAKLETLFGGVNDSLFGFRIYPIEKSLRAMRQTRHGRRFDFDTELAVRLFWMGVRPVSRQVPVYYPPKNMGGVSHFGYLRDNLLLIRTHTRLCFLLLPRMLAVWKLRQQWKSLKGQR